MNCHSLVDYLQLMDDRFNVLCLKQFVCLVVCREGAQVICLSTMIVIDDRRRSRKCYTPWELSFLRCTDWQTEEHNLSHVTRQQFVFPPVLSSASTSQQNRVFVFMTFFSSCKSFLGVALFYFCFYILYQFQKVFDRICPAKSKNLFAKTTH